MTKYPRNVTKCNKEEMFLENYVMLIEFDRNSIGIQNLCFNSAMLKSVYLDSPIKHKNSESGQNEHIIYGASEMQGWRFSQEDDHNCILNFDKDVSFFAIYDGHGGQGKN
uniref:PPM-type phosphatase domain-containing protein n=1 Tax=Romanomermis culicivorax TaxID=13658 RepID=A0A915KUI8_ROMCU